MRVTRLQGTHGVAACMCQVRRGSGGRAMTWRAGGMAGRARARRRGDERRDSWRGAPCRGGHHRVPTLHAYRPRGVGWRRGRRGRQGWHRRRGGRRWGRREAKAFVRCRAARDDTPLGDRPVGRVGVRIQVSVWRMQEARVREIRRSHGEGTRLAERECSRGGHAVGG